MISSKHTAEVSDADFKKQVLDAKGLKLVDFWAEWCGPCRYLGPIVEQISDEYAGKVGVFKLDVDKSPITAGYFQVQSIPTLLFFKDGKVVEQLVGARPKADITKALEKHLA